MYHLARRVDVPSPLRDKNPGKPNPAAWKVRAVLEAKLQQQLSTGHKELMAWLTDEKRWDELSQAEVQSIIYGILPVKPNDNAEEFTAAGFFSRLIHSGSWETHPLAAFGGRPKKVPEDQLSANDTEKLHHRAAILAAFLTAIRLVADHDLKELRSTLRLTLREVATQLLQFGCRSLRRRPRAALSHLPGIF